MENLNLIHLFILEIQSMLEKTMAKLATPISDMANQKIFDQVLIFVNLHQHAKNQANSSISSGDIVDLKTLQRDWLRGFRPLSQEQDFPQIWDLGKNTANNITFHRTNSEKFKYQIFQLI